MTSTTDHLRTASHFRHTTLLGAAVAGALIFSACGATTTTSAPSPEPPPTTGMGPVTTPAGAPSVPATTTLPFDTTPAPPAPTPPAPAPPAPAPPAPAPPAPSPTAPAPPPTTTAPPLIVSRTYDLESVQASHEESGGGINSGNGWWLTPQQLRVEASTAHGPLAIAEQADVRVRLHSTIQPPAAVDSTLSWDLTWVGYATSFVGADSSAQTTITMRVVELDTTSQDPTRGPVVWEQVVYNDGVGAALQGVATLRMDGSSNATAEMPILDPDKVYRVEAELHCQSRVAFSIGATVCDFQSDGQGLWVNDWQLVFPNVPVPNTH